MKKIISVLISAALVLALLPIVAFAESSNDILFEENFDAASESVVINNSTFSYVARPEDGADVNTQTAYGALMSDKTQASKVRVNFNQLYDGNIVYEMDFRLEGPLSKNSNYVKLIRLMKNNTPTGMITLWAAEQKGYKIRVCSQDENGTVKYVIGGDQDGMLDFKTWHKLRVEINTSKNTYSVYVNDHPVTSDEKSYKNDFSIGLNAVDIYTDGALDNALLVDNIVLRRELAITSDVYWVSSNQIYGDFENKDVETFLSNLRMPLYSSAVLYSDYETKTVRTGIVEDGDVLVIASSMDASKTKIYTLGALSRSDTFYVSPNGNDLNDGTTPETAFATLNQARIAVSYSKSMQPNRAYSVKFLAGEYYIDETVEFSAKDSGSAGYPIVYEAYGDGPVQFKGSKTLSADKAVKVTDPDILNTLISSEAKNNLYKIDLKAEGIKIPTMPGNFGYGAGGYKPLRVYINGQALTEAQFPNAGDVQIPVKVVNNEDTAETDGFYDMTYYDNDAPLSRTSKWNTKDRDIYIAGTLMQQWEFNHMRVKTFDPENDKIIFDKYRSGEFPIGRVYFYFTNVFEEIDVPGESYIDEENGILYFMPNGDLTNAKIEISTMEDEMISMTDTDYITFKNLNFGYTGNKIIDAMDSDYFTMEGCELAHTSTTAIQLSGHHTLIRNNHIYDLAGYSGRGGIHLTKSGDRATLTSGESKIVNNKIHDTDVIYKVSQSPAIYILESVGTEISNNEIYNGTAYVVRITDCNDILFKRNEVYNAVTMSSDAGALTWGRDITLLGFQVIENYFHDIGNDIGIREQESTGQECKRTGQQAIFHDDGSSGPYAYGNIFYQSKPIDTINNFYSIKANGGQYGIWENNIFIGGHAAGYFGSWSTGYNGKNMQDIWWLRQYNVYELGDEHDVDGKGGSAIYWDRLSNKNLNFFENQVWKDKYGAQYGEYWTLFTPEQKTYLDSVYDSSLSGIKNNTDLLAAAAVHTDLLTNTNITKNNVLIDTLTPIEYKDTANYHEAEGAVMGKFTSDVAAAWFENYGTDFDLTDAGLAELQKTVPAFQAIDFDSIGLQETAGFTLENATLENDTLSLDVDNASFEEKSGLLIVVAYKDGKVQGAKVQNVSVAPQFTKNTQIALPAGTNGYKVYALKSIFSMQIFSNILER